jgi:hypothetical protein
MTTVSRSPFWISEFNLAAYEQSQAGNVEPEQ